MGEESEEGKVPSDEVGVALSGLKDLIDLRDLAGAKLANAIRDNAHNMETLFDIYAGLHHVSMERLRVLLRAKQDAKKCSG